MSETMTIAAGHGLAVRLSKGDAITIVNQSGTQVVDTWAFCADDLTNVMSMAHSRVENGRLCAREGGHYVTNRREPILQVERDVSPGIHDTIMAACDPQRYRNLGCTTSHRSCACNLAEALAAIGCDEVPTPQPLNLFMNIPIGEDQTLIQGAPAGQPGDFVTLRALRDCIVGLSSCPQDITPINGGTPTDVPIVVDRVGPSASGSTPAIGK